MRTVPTMKIKVPIRLFTGCAWRESDRMLKEISVPRGSGEIEGSFESMKVQETLKLTTLKK